MLVYEPLTPLHGPIPLARIDNPGLALMIARSALSEADSKAARLAHADEFLGYLERAEADRLRLVLTTLIPELQVTEEAPSPPVM
jgi:hypothetical protein